MTIVACDVGRYRAKFYSDGRMFSFPAYVGEYRELNLERELTREDMVLGYRGKQYFVGAIARDESLDGQQNFLSSKANYDTLLMGLIGIHAMVNDDDDDVCVVVGHPVANHTVHEKDAMRKLFVGQHTVTVNGATKIFTVAHVIVTAECACATYLLPTRHPVAYGIDGGGATTNFVTWHGGKWIDKLSGTLPYGMENCGMSLERYARMVAIDTSRIIHTFGGPIYAMGGVSVELANALQQYITNVRIIPLEDGAWVNARSYYTVGSMVSQKLSTQRQM